MSGWPRTIFAVPAAVLRQERSGPAAARNAGVAAARGERIAFLGDDTVPAPSWLAEHARAHRERGDSPLLAVLGRTRWHRRIRVTPFLDYLNEGGQQFGYGLIRGGEEIPFNFFYTSNVSLARELLVAEPFDVHFPFAVWEDIECSYRLHRRGLRLVYEPAAVVEHDHPTDLERFSQRQQRAGAAAVVFYRLHPELGPYLGIGPQGPPPLPSSAWYRACLSTARVIDKLPVGGAMLWNAILRYHYIVGLQRGWLEANGAGEQDAASVPEERTSAARSMSARARQRLAGRVHSMVPLPGADVAYEEGGWRVTGKNPILRLQTDRVRFPSGWAGVSYAWSGRAGAEPAALLVESPEGREDVFHLPPATLGTSLVLRFPRRVQGIRVRPPAGLERFDLVALQVAELNRLQTLRIFLAPYLAPLRRDPRMIGHYLLRSVSSIRRHGPRALWQTIAGRFAAAREERYAEWVERYGRLDETDRGAARSQVAALRHRALFSLILPARGEDGIDESLRSIRDQWYEDWELLVVGFGGTAPAVESALRRAAGGDPRIRFVASQAATRAAAANEALAVARGEYCAIVEPDAELAPHALYHLAVGIDDAPDTELLYSDEDQLDSLRRRANPTFKPDWDPDLLLGCDSVGHLAAYRSALLRSLNGWREGIDGYEDWDLALRVSAAVDERRVRHVPHVLWHSRRRTEVRPDEQAAPAARLVLEEHLRRVGSAARLRSGATLRLDYPIGDPPPLVSFIIPTRNRLDLLRPCVDGLLQRTDYPALELLIVSNGSDDPSMLAYLEALPSDPRVRVLRFDAPFNYSAVNNLAARHANGSFLALLNDDIEVIDPDWLTRDGRAGVASGRRRRRRAALLSGRQDPARRRRPRSRQRRGASLSRPAVRAARMGGVGERAAPRLGRDRRLHGRTDGALPRSRRPRRGALSGRLQRHRLLPAPRPARLPHDPHAAREARSSRVGDARPRPQHRDGAPPAPRGGVHARTLGRGARGRSRLQPEPDARQRQRRGRISSPRRPAVARPRAPTSRSRPRSPERMPRGLARARRDGRDADPIAVRKEWASPTASC